MYRDSTQLHLQGINFHGDSQSNNTNLCLEYLTTVVDVSTRTAPVAGHALTALSWWPSTGPDHGSEAEMPTLGTVAMSKTRDSDTRPREPATLRLTSHLGTLPLRLVRTTRWRWPHQRIQICRLTSHDTIFGHPRVS